MFKRKKKNFGGGFERRYLLFKFFFRHFFIDIFHIDRLLNLFIYRLNLLSLPLILLKEKIEKISYNAPYNYSFNALEKMNFFFLWKSYPATKNIYKYPKIYMQRDH